jgi:hypothetical protein
MLDLEVIAQAPQAEDRPPVPGFSGWWDASDQASVQTAIGDHVSQWRDKSGNARHLTQATDATRPYTGSWSQNGRNVVWTHGKTTFMQGASPQSGQPYTLVTVAADTVGDGNQRDLWIMRVGSGEGRLYRNSGDDILLYGGATVSSGRKWERRRPHVVTSVFNTSATQIRVDGRYSASGSLGHTGDASWTVFAFPGGSEAWMGWIGEIVAYARLLTASEIQLTESYLTRKWGVQ